MKRFLIVLISCIVFTLAFVGGDRATHATSTLSVQNVQADLIDYSRPNCPCHM